ncbi:MAG: LpxI family protein [Candidatus Muiribacteriota bacterium]
MKKIGLIAGNGRFPILISKEIKKQGFELVVAAIKNEALKEIQSETDVLKWISLGSLQKLIDFFINQNVEDIIMVGKVTKSSMYFGLEIDEKFQNCLNELKTKNDMAILERLEEEFKKSGIHLINPKNFLGNFFSSKGVLTQRKPVENENKDIEYGMKMAKEVANLDIGQTVVVKEQVVLAVEGVEGTDRVIERGGRLGNGQVVVAKASRSSQDLRFDIPAVGLDTIKVMIDNDAHILAVDESTILLQKVELIEFANKNNICIVVI